MPDNTATTLSTPPERVLSPGGTVMLPGIGDSGITPDGQRGANSNLPSRQQIDAAKQAGIAVDKNIEERRRQEDEGAEAELKEREWQEKNKASIGASAALIENPTADQADAVKTAKDTLSKVEQQAQEETDRARKQTLADAAKAYDDAKVDLQPGQELALTKEEFLAKVTADFDQKATQYHQDVLKSFLSGGPVATLTPTAAGYAQTQLAPYIKDGQIDVQGALMSGDFTNAQLTRLLSKAGVENAEDAVKAGNARLSGDTKTLEAMGLMTYTYPGIDQTFKSREDFANYVGNLSQDEKERLGLLVWTIHGVDKDFKSDAELKTYWNSLSNDEQVRIAKANGWPVTEITEGGSVIHVQGIDRDFSSTAEFEAYWKGLSNEEQVRIARTNDWPVTETKVWAIPGIDKNFDSQEAMDKYWDGLSPEVQLSIAKDNGWPITYAPAEGGTGAESAPGPEGIKVQGVDATFDSPEQFDEFWGQLSESRQEEIARLNGWPITIQVKGVDATFNSEAQFQEYFDQLSPERQLAIAKLNGWQISETPQPTKQTFSIPGIDKNFDTEEEAQAYFAKLSPAVQEQIARDNGLEITYTQQPPTPTRGLGSISTGDALAKWKTRGVATTTAKGQEPIVWAKLNATYARAMQPYSKYIDLKGNFDIPRAVQDGVNETKLRDYLIKGGVQNAEQVINDTKTMLATTVIIRTGERVDADFYNSLSKFKQEKINQLGVDGFNLSERSGYDREVKAIQRVEGQLSAYIIGRDVEGNPQYDLDKLVDDRLASQSESKVVASLGVIFGEAAVRDTIAVNKAIKNNDTAELERRGLLVIHVEGVNQDFNSKAAFDTYWATIPQDEQVRLAKLNKWTVTETTVWRLPDVDKDFATKEEAEAYAVGSTQETDTSKPSYPGKIPKPGEYSEPGTPPPANVPLVPYMKSMGQSIIAPYTQSPWVKPNSLDDAKQDILLGLKATGQVLYNSTLTGAIRQAGGSTREQVVAAAMDLAMLAMMAGGAVKANIRGALGDTAKLASEAGNAHLDFNLALERAAISEAHMAENPTAVVMDMANLKAAANQSIKADKAFASALPTAKNLTPTTLRLMEKESGMVGVKGAVLDVGRAQAGVQKAWAGVDKATVGTPQYLKALERLQTARNGLDNSLVKLGKVTSPRISEGTHAGWTKIISRLETDLAEAQKADSLTASQLAQNPTVLWAREESKMSRDALSHAQAALDDAQIAAARGDLPPIAKGFAMPSDVKGGKPGPNLTDAVDQWLADERNLHPNAPQPWESNVAVKVKTTPKPTKTMDVSMQPIKEGMTAAASETKPIPKVTPTKPSVFPGVTTRVRTERPQPSSADTTQLDISRMTPEQVAKEMASRTDATPEMPYQPIPISVPRVNPTVRPTVVPAVTPRVTPQTTPQTTPSTKPITRPNITPGTTPSTTPQTTPRITPDIQPNIRPGTRPKIKPNITPEIKPEIRPSTRPSTEPVTKPTTTPQTRPQTTPTTRPKTTPTTTPSITPGTKPVVTPKVNPVIKPIVTPQVHPQINPQVKPAVKIQVKAAIRTATRIDLKASTKPSFKVQVNPQIKPKTGAKLKAETRVTTKLKEDVTQKGPKATGGFKLPNGSTLPPGVYPRKVRFPLGKSKVGVDIDTRAINYSRNTGDPKQKPQAGFKVVTTDKTRPKPQRFPQGIVDMVVTEDSISFELNKGRSESPKSLIRRLRKEGKL